MLYCHVTLFGAAFSRLFTSQAKHVDLTVFICVNKYGQILVTFWWIVAELFQIFSFSAGKLQSENKVPL